MLDDQMSGPTVAADTIDMVEQLEHWSRSWPVNIQKTADRLFLPQKDIFSCSDRRCVHRLSMPQCLSVPVQFPSFSDFFFSL
jgi:hypothetical protein